MIDCGSGPPLVLVPGIQGRYEWMQPAIDALAATTRVLSVSLAGEPRSGARFDPSRGLDAFLDQIDALVDRAGLTAVAVCGVSFGGLIALRYAVTRPARVCALVLVSTPGPDWDPSRGIRPYLRHPWLQFPHFALGAIGRAVRELGSTFPERRARLAAAARYLGLVARAPTSPARMAARAALGGGGSKADCARIACPTLVVTGEPHLDRVVPVVTTLEYTRLIKGARAACLARTGHLGPITRPDRFGEIVGGFVVQHACGGSERTDRGAVGASP